MIDCHLISISDCVKIYGHMVKVYRQTDGQMYRNTDRYTDRLTFIKKKFSGEIKITILTVTSNIWKMVEIVSSLKPKKIYLHHVPNVEGMLDRRTTSLEECSIHVPIKVGSCSSKWQIIFISKKGARQGCNIEPPRYGKRDIWLHTRWFWSRFGSGFGSAFEWPSGSLSALWMCLRIRI